jgi:hypothetical protein
MGNYAEGYRYGDPAFILFLILILLVLGTFAGYC